MWRRTWLVAGLATVLVAPAPAAARVKHAHPRVKHAHKHVKHTHKHVRPRAFASCTALVGYAKGNFAATQGRPDPPLAPLTVSSLAPVPVSGGSAGTQPQAASNTTAASSPSPTFSTTNNQESGVDEPDVAKTNGTSIFFISQHTLYAIAVGSGPPQLVGSLDLGTNGYGAQLLLRGNHLIVISHSGLRAVPLAAPRQAAGGAPVSEPAFVEPSPYYYRAQTTVNEVDVSNPGRLHVTRTMTVDGDFVDARQNGSTARLVIASAPLAISDAAVRSRPGGWVPTRSFHSLLSGRRYVRPVARCTSVQRPVQFSGVGMLTILTLNLDKGLWTAGSQALMANAQVVYGSPGSLYVATQRWVDPQTAVDQLPPLSTVIDQFDATNPDTSPLVASGEVPGYLLNQFSLSEYNGYLRAATTSRPIWWGAGPPQSLSQSYVTVLADQGGQLLPVGQVAGLGQGQQIYSVRFVGNTGYVVTFRQVDPLYVVDLATPSAPAVTGQLELSGVSSYLHPLGNGLLLGVGEDISANEPSGAQLELFDVANPKAPALLARTSLGQGSSTTAQFDHHAFLFWPATALAVLPVALYPQSSQPQPQQQQSQQSSDSPFVGAIGFHVDRSGISEVGRVSHPASNDYQWPIQRAIVVGDHIYTLSDAGVMESNLATLASQAFVALPATAPPAPGYATAAASRRRR